jgi:hypothetical protein
LDNYADVECSLEVLLGERWSYFRMCFLEVTIKKYFYNTNYMQEFILAMNVILEEQTVLPPPTT